MPFHDPMRLPPSGAAAPVALVVAILIAVPLRDRLQRVANRLVFGLRDDPVATLLSLGDQLERAAVADDVLPGATRSLQRTLRLQHVAILDGDTVAAEAGRPSDGRRVSLPLVYAGETVGTLVATQSEGDTPMDAERYALLTGIARPVASVAATRTASLPSAKSNLVQPQVTSMPSPAPNPRRRSSLGMPLGGSRRASCSTCRRWRSAGP